MTANERTILERLKVGNDADWTQFVRFLLPLVAEKVSSQVGDDEKAEDLANEIVISFVANLRRFSFPADPPAPGTS